MAAGAGGRHDPGRRRWPPRRSLTGSAAAAVVAVAAGGRRRAGAAGRVPAVRAVVARAGRGGAAGRRDPPARLRAGAGLGLLDRAGVLRAAAGLDQPAHRLPAVGAAVRSAGRLHRVCWARPAPGCQPAGRPVALGVAAGDRAAVGGAGGAARPDPVRRVPVGPARVQPGRLAAAAARRARRGAAGHVRGRRSPAGCWSRPSGCWRRRGAPAAAPAGVGVALGRRWSRWRRCCWRWLARRRSAGRPAAPVRRRHGGDRAGQRAPARAWTSTPSAGPCWTTTSTATLELARRVAAGRAAAARPGGVAGELQRHRPAAQPRRRGRGSPRPPTRSARRSWSARCCDGAGPGRSRNAGHRSGSPGTGPDLDQLYVKRHPVPFAEYMPLRAIARLVSDKVDLVRHDFVGRDTPGVMRVGPADARRRDLLRGRLRRDRPRHRHRRRAAARGADQQRHVQRGRGPPAAGDGAAAGGRARPGRADGLHRRGVGVRRHRRAGARRDRLQHRRGRWCASCASATAVRLLPAWAAGPRWRWSSLCRSSPSWPAACVRRRRRGPRDRPTARQMRRTRERDDRWRSSGGLPGRRPGARHHPHLQRGGQLRVDHRSGSAARCPAVDILVADDNSPDGTGAIADELAAADDAHPRAAPARQAGPRRRVPGRVRLGRASTATTRSSRWTPTARTPPRSCPSCSTRCPRRRRGARLPVGARRQGASTGRCTGCCSPAAATSTSGWRWACRSRTPPAATGPTGCRCSTRSTCDTVASQGYCFQVELAWRAHRHGFRIVEVPITFAERERGASKMSSSIVREALLAGHRVGCCRPARTALRARLDRGAAPDRPGRDRAPACHAGRVGATRRSRCAEAWLCCRWPCCAGGRRDRRVRRGRHAHRRRLGAAAGARRVARRRLVLLRREGIRGLAGVPGRGAEPAGRRATQVTDGLVGLRRRRCCWRVPGFITGVVGLLLLLPPVRRLARPRRCSGCDRAAGRRRPSPATCSARGGSGCAAAAAAADRRPTDAAPAPRRRRPPAIEGEIVERPDVRPSSTRERRRRPRAPPGVPSSCVAAAQVAAAAGADLLQPLVEDVLQLGDRRRSSSMSQWVRGGLAFFCSGSLPSTSRATLPSNLHSQVIGHLGVDGERHLELVTLRAQVLAGLPGRQLGVAVGLVADCAKTAAAQHALAHDRLSPRSWCWSSGVTMRRVPGFPGPRFSLLKPIERSRRLRVAGHPT